MKTIHPLRLAIKVLLVFGLLNICFAGLKPPVGKLTLYNSIFPGRVRFPFGNSAKNNNITIDDLDAMFASHVISNPKQPDEIRVILLGDSAVWGERLLAQEMISSQLNELNISCADRKVRFYNLGYPHPSLLKDLVILDEALDYEPDMVVWLVTLNSFGNKRPHPFIIANHDRALRIVDQYHLDIRQRKSLEVPAPSLVERTVLAQREGLARLLQLQSFGLIWMATGYDISFAYRNFEPLPEDVQAENDYYGLLPPADMKKNMMLGMLDAGVHLAGNLPVLFVNEPVYVADGRNSHIRYNEFYPRWAYDQYREELAAYTAAHGWHYLDLWNSIPPAEFTNTPLHLSPVGEQDLAGALGPAVRSIICP